MLKKPQEEPHQQAPPLWPLVLYKIGRPTLTTNSIDYRMLGSEDIYKVIKTGERYSYDIAYNPIDKVLLEMGINLTGTNNRYQSVTMLNYHR